MVQVKRFENNRLDAIAYVPRISRVPTSVPAYSTSVDSWDFRASIFGTRIPGSSSGGEVRHEEKSPGICTMCRRARARHRNDRRRSRGAAPRGRRSRGPAKTSRALKRSVRGFSFRETRATLRRTGDREPNGAEPSRRARNRTSALYSGSLYL